MAQTTIIKAQANPSVTAADDLYFEKDWAIRRPVWKALLDFSNPKTVAQTGALSNGMSLVNLVEGGANGSVQGSFAAVHNGTIRSAGASNLAALVLPGDGCFYIPPATQKALVITWMRAPKTGWPAGTLVGVIGAGTGANNATQWTFYLQDATGSDGVIDRATLRVRSGPAAWLDTVLLAGADLDNLLDGNLHQIGMLMECDGTTGRATIYVDGDVVASASVAMTAFNRPASSVANAMNGGNVGINSPTATALAAQDMRVTRLGAIYLDGYDITPAEVLAMDAEAAAGFVS